MSIVHPNPNSDPTLASYCARVALAVAIIVIGLKISADHWPSETVRLVGCAGVWCNALSGD
jgi:hypothetical protein